MKGGVNMDVKEIIEQIVPMIMKNNNLAKDFEANPVKTIEAIIKKDLPDDMVNLVISGVKAALAGDKAGGIMDGIKKMF
jgi:hypothetical protein